MKNNEEVDIKKSFSAFGAIIIICGICGIATSMIVVGVPLLVIDTIIGTDLATKWEDLLWTGSEISRYFKTWLTGITMTLFYLQSKNWKIQLRDKEAFINYNLLGNQVENIGKSIIRIP